MKPKYIISHSVGNEEKGTLFCKKGAIQRNRFLTKRLYSKRRKEVNPSSNKFLCYFLYILLKKE